jgi:predicted CopG family antitoxin|tara:strand:+ start:1525 stop:1644 length:120 start_codon:yes stop_codon:yes gene_type:complete
MKTINETFEDEEYEALIDRKGDKSWRDFILSAAKVKKKQ